jgi:hypothetical protein
VGLAGLHFVATAAGVSRSPSPLGWAATGAHAPPVHAELPSNGHYDLFAFGSRGLVVGEHGLPFGHRTVGGLKLQQPPGQFD